MASTPEGEGRAGTAFSEKSFYLSEFRGRTLAIAVPAADLGQPGPLEAVLKELAKDVGLLTYWRTTGEWGAFARPLPNDDFECW